MSTEYESLLKAVEESKDHYDKFFNHGVKAAGTRLRKSLQDVKKLSQVVRNSVQEVKKAEKTS